MEGTDISNLQESVTKCSNHSHAASFEFRQQISSLPAAMQLQKSEHAQKEAVERAVTATNHWMERFTVVVIGPGLGRDELVHNTVIQVCCLGCADHLAYSTHPQINAIFTAEHMHLMRCWVGCSCRNA